MDMWAWAPVLIHGDVGPGNIRYSARRGAICGVIDFSSIAFYIGAFALQEALHGLDSEDSGAYNAGMKDYI
jgi:Ser/Thr protein kinase RdoA (MazF antagonist)